MIRLALAALLALGLAAPAAAQAPQKVVFALNWFAVGDHAAYWVALEKGYYKEKDSRSSSRTPRARQTPSPRWTPAAPTSAWPTRRW
jgi:ABC-type nitrate/sulfonate/bicarbonate transport system substrate-binding protein